MDHGISLWRVRTFLMPGTQLLSYHYQSSATNVPSSFKRLNYVNSKKTNKISVVTFARQNKTP